MTRACFYKSMVMKKERKQKEIKKEILWKVWLVLGIICLMYFVGLIAYTGFTNLFYCIWAPAGMMFFVFSWMAKKHLVESMPRWFRLICGTFISICLVVFFFVEGLILSGFYRMPTEEVEYVVVLGAHVKNGKPSRVLAKRLDAAYDYAMEHRDVVVIVSGGQGGNETTTEAYAMACYLEEKGLEENRILKEEKSTSTHENLVFSMELMDDNPSIAVVSNDFHIYRATHLARAVGYDNPQGLAARDDIRTVPANLVREFFGVVKDVATGNMKLFPVW